MTADQAFLAQCIDQALGRAPADLVVKGGRFLNLVTGEVATGDIAVCGDRIVGTYANYRGRIEIDGSGLIAVPGFIDAHVHVESSLVTPAEFDRCVLPRGTTTAVCDPHEIANVLGEVGLRFFLDSASATLMDLRVQLSSCVPATGLETSGARLEAEDLARYRGHDRALGLAEFMNYPGVLTKQGPALDKLAAFQDGIIDGHAPLVAGRDLNALLACRIRNCHESTQVDEAREKLRKGMQVFIRDSSVSKDVRTLSGLISAETSPFLGFCTDDRNPLDILDEGHIDHLVRTAIAQGAPVVDVYRAASWSAARGFGLDDRGLIAPGQRADLVLLEDLESCTVAGVVKDGRLVSSERFGHRPAVATVGAGSVKRAAIRREDLRVPAGASRVPVIGLIPGKIITEFRHADLPRRQGERLPDPDNDILKVCVLERHGVNGNIGRGFVQGFGFRSGALASSVGHDSHNICVVGSDDDDMALAVNRLIALDGGLVAARDGTVLAELALPIAGLMSREPFETVRDALGRLRDATRALGCRVDEPFLHLAFLPLPVIPHLKITDKGMVDVDRFVLLGEP